MIFFNRGYVKLKKTNFLRGKFLTFIGYKQTDKHSIYKEVHYIYSRAVWTFIGFKQTDRHKQSIYKEVHYIHSRAVWTFIGFKQTDRQEKYIYGST